MMAVEGYQAVAFQWSMVAFTLVLVLLRLYTRISRSIAYRPLPAWSDFFLVLAWCSFALQACLNQVQLRENFFDPRINAPGPAAGAYTTVLALKIYYIQNLTYLNCVYAVKASMLSLYEEFFPQYMKWTRLCMNITIIFLIITWILQVLLCAFWCTPISRNWSMDVKVYCSCWTSHLVGYLSLSPHFLSDIIIYFLPIPVLYRLTLPRKQKIGLYVTFSCGFICIFFAAAFAVASTATHSLAFMNIFGTLEQAYAVIVGCCPLFRAFLGEGRRLSISLSRMRKGGGAAQKKEKMDYEVGVLVAELRNDQQRHHRPPSRGTQLLQVSGVEKSKASSDDRDADAIATS